MSVTPAPLFYATASPGHDLTPPLTRRGRRNPPSLHVPPRPTPSLPPAAWRHPHRTPSFCSATPPFFSLSLTALSSLGEARRSPLHFSPLPLVRAGNRSVLEAVGMHHPPATEVLVSSSRSGAAFTSTSTALVSFSSPTSKSTLASSPPIGCW
jgi:hypothetical protein